MFRNLQMNKIKEIFGLFASIAAMMILSNLLSFIDTAMVTNYNKYGATAVTIPTQMQFLIGPVYFAIMTGIGIYTVQYFARKEYNKIRKISVMAFVMMIPIGIINFIFLLTNPDTIIGAYTTNKEVYSLSLKFLQVYNYSLLLLPFESFFMYQYRAIKKPKIPLIIGVSQALLNVILNYLLIFGNFGFPALGIEGAAFSTLISRLVFTIINFIIANKLKVPFLFNIREFININYHKFKEVLFSTIPLIVVEFGFGVGNILYTLAYSKLDIISFNAFNISKTISFTINAFVIATASVASIVVGEVIAKGVSKKSKELRITLDNLFIFIWISSLIILIFSFFILPLFINFFQGKNTGFDKNQMNLIKNLLIVNGFWMAIRVFASSYISILKSGNDNRFVILVDAGSTFLVGIPLTFCTLLFTNSIIILRSIIILEVLCKVILGYYRYKKGKWIRRLD